jgi:hypothetical protein
MSNSTGPAVQRVADAAHSTFAVRPVARHQRSGPRQPAGSINFQSPSEMTSATPSTTLIAVWSSMA